MDAVIKKLRSNPLNLTAAEVIAMLLEMSFYDSLWNRKGSGFNNSFELMGNEIVIDNTSGLMWQKGGSSEPMGFKTAKKWVADMNKHGFAGYQDWRIPTLEEAMSLMKPMQQNDLYIDPIFDSKQAWIWTSDSSAVGWQWVVAFNDGICDNYYLYGSCYVRVVR